MDKNYCFEVWLGLRMGRVGYLTEYLGVGG